jgi:heat shock protein HtpX
MLVTMLLLGAVYVVLDGSDLRRGANGITIVVVAGRPAAPAVLRLGQARPALHGRAGGLPPGGPELHAMIERLCIQADLPKPKIAIAHMAMPNAFAVGRSPKNATVCADHGIMELLSPAELEGVMAHELTHIANRDVAIMTLASFFASLASMIVQFGFFFGGGYGHSDDDDNPSALFLVMVSLAVYVISFFLMQALSRYREFAADRGAAVITGRPSALSSALMKISSGMERIPQTDLRQNELAAFYIFPPGAKKAVGGLFATHPPMEKRIEALNRLELQLQGSTAVGRAR